MLDEFLALLNLVYKVSGLLKCYGLLKSPEIGGLELIFNDLKIS
tara:strand:+ start:116 stop:247 length:132 start_codon:yes stop_codon:yes gene_type:complete